jgi:hypothetical protein
MPYQLEWLQDKRIVREVLSGEFDLAASTELAAATAKCLEEGTAPIHLIIDVTDMVKSPTNLRSINSVTDYMKDPKLGWVVLIGANTMVKFISSVISHITKFKFTTVANLDEAVSFLQKQDATLKVEQIAQ